MNDVKLQSSEGTHPLDENLRPLKIGNKTAPLELSDTDVRVNNFQVSGTTKVNNLQVSGTTTGVTAESDDDKLSLSGGTMTGDIEATGNFAINPTGDLYLNADGFDIYIQTNDTTYAHFKNTGALTQFFLYEAGGASADDYFKISTSAHGYTAITTLDAAGEAADLIINIDGDIALDSQTGVFIAKKAGTEFSPANSSYSGMILGCTHVFGSGTGGTFMSVSTSFVSLVWDTDKYALVTFVVPPSNKVKIAVHLPFISAGGIAFQLGLATDSSATSLGTKYENDVDDANRSDSFNINYSWVVEGSDHSWSAGETKTLYIMAYAASTIRFRTGGTNAGGYGGVIVEATALPATIGDGSEP